MPDPERPEDEEHVLDPNLPIAMSWMLAVLFLGLGLALLAFGKTQGGFASLVLATFALLTALFKRRARCTDPDD